MPFICTLGLILLQIVCTHYIYFMIKVQIGISNLKPRNLEHSNAQNITIRFGTVMILINLDRGIGGKCVFLDLEQQEIYKMLKQYAFSLFIQNQNGKFYSILNLSALGFGDKIICHQIHFFDQQRQIAYDCEFSVEFSELKKPRIPDLNHLRLMQEAVAQSKKPPVFTVNQIIKTNPNFYQNQKGSSNNVQKEAAKTIQAPLPLYHNKKAKTMKNAFQKTKKIDQADLMYQAQQIPANLAYNGLDDEEEDGQPPMMEFRKGYDNQKIQISPVPQIQPIFNSRQELYPQRKPNNSEDIMTFNRKAQTMKETSSPEGPSEFQLAAKRKERPISIKVSNPKTLTRLQIQELAKKEAEEKQRKQNIMIPIVKGDKFELVPLSTLKPDEIIEYVHRQKKIEEEAKANENAKKRLQIQRENLKERQKLIQKKNERQPPKRNQKQLKQQIQEKEEEHQQSFQDEQSYISDFQSMSITNSAIKSRYSSKGNPIHNKSKDQSVIQDQYSQDFQTYSQSVLSKTNHKPRANSASEYSESFRSISQSYRK